MTDDSDTGVFVSLRNGRDLISRMRSSRLLESRKNEDALAHAHACHGRHSLGGTERVSGGNPRQQLQSVPCARCRMCQGTAVLRFQLLKALMAVDGAPSPPAPVGTEGPSPVVLSHSLTVGIGKPVREPHSQGHGEDSRVVGSGLERLRPQMRKCCWQPEVAIAAATLAIKLGDQLCDLERAGLVWPAGEDRCPLVLDSLA